MIQDNNKNFFHRFGHSMVSKEIFARDSNFIDRTRLSLKETFFDLLEFETDTSFVDKTVRGQIVETAQGWDPGFNDDIRNNLFDEELDLVSLNINRGREHGIPGKRNIYFRNYVKLQNIS